MFEQHQQKQQQHQLGYLCCAVAGYLAGINVDKLNNMLPLFINVTLYTVLSWLPVNGDQGTHSN